MIRRRAIDPPRRSGSLSMIHPAGADAATILLTRDARLKELNHQFRGKDKPTNVLSFVSA